METENRLIAEFMALLKISNETYPILYKDKNSDEWFAPDELKYHSDWNWLMEVVEKIENMEYENRCSKYNFEMVQTFVEIIDNNNSDTIVEIYKNTKIQATYKAVVEFIKWYNEQK